MRHRRWLSLLLTAVLAVCLLSGCGLGAQSGLIHLNKDVIQDILQKDGLNITVTEQDALNQAVEQAAQNLDGAQRPDPEPAAVRSQIAREIGTPPLISAACMTAPIGPTAPGETPTATNRRRRLLPSSCIKRATAMPMRRL